MTASSSDTGTIPQRPGITVPKMHWRDVERYVNETWDLHNAPHHSVIGLTGSGKSYLVGNGILRTRGWDRVIAFDSKGGADDTLNALPFNTVDYIPKNSRLGGGSWGRKREQYDSWWKVVLSSDRRKAQHQVAMTLNRVWEEGEWITWFDELRNLTHPRDPNLGMESPINRLYTMGRAKHIGIIACTQSPVWVPHTFFDQASFAWIGRIRDEVRQKRLLEIGGMTKKELPHIQALEKRHWMLAAENGDFFATTKVE